MLRRSAILLVMLLAACNLNVPEVTPTVAPSRTPSLTPIVTITQTPSQTPTRTPDLTEIALLFTPTNTSIPTDTETAVPSDTPSSTPTPSETPTGTPPPTFTPSRTPLPTNTLTDTPTNTPLPTDTPTFTPFPSDTPTAPPTDTPVPTDTPTFTSIPTLTPTGTLPPSKTPTNTPIPSDTPTFTPAPTDTPVPSPTPLPLPTDTPTPIPSSTFTDTPTLTPTLLPSETPTPSATSTNAPTPTPRPTDTPAPTATNPPTLTPLPTLTNTVEPSLTPTNTLSPLQIAVSETVAATLTAPPRTAVVQIGPQPTAVPPRESPTPGPTLDVTPTTIIISAPFPISTALSPVPVTDTPEVATATATSLPTLPAPTSLLEPVNMPSANNFLGQNPGIQQNTLGYLLNSSGADVIGSPFPSLIANPWLLAQNPADPNQYIAVNTSGQIYFISDYAGGRLDRLNIDIFTEFHYGPMLSRDENDKPVTSVEWSRQGVLAFIVDGDRGDDDGVWLWRPDGTNQQLLRECPVQDACTVLERQNLSRWDAIDAEWSPDGTRLLVTLRLDDEGRRALIIIDPDNANPEIIPPVQRFDYGSWSADGTRIIVSGRAPTGTMVLGSTDLNGQDWRLTNMNDRGYGWVQSGVEYRGALYAFASRDANDAPVQLVNGDGTTLTDPIGTRRPERIDWSPDGSAALLEIHEGDRARYYIVPIANPVPQEITEQVANAMTVQWIGQPANVPAGNAPAPTVQPTPAAPGLQPGQQAQVITQQLNLRTTTSALDNSNIIVVLSYGDTVTIIAGPIYNEDYPWYQVTLANGVIGWVAGAIYGTPTLQ